MSALPRKLLPVPVCVIGNEEPIPARRTYIMYFPCQFLRITLSCTGWFLRLIYPANDKLPSLRKRARSILSTPRGKSGYGGDMSDYLFAALASWIYPRLHRNHRYHCLVSSLRQALLRYGDNRKDVYSQHFRLDHVCRHRNQRISTK